jgi:NADH:ubiquinone oxidoreductase subunit F (NADH-binding)
MQILEPTGFQAFEKAISMKPIEVIQKVKESGLRGRGGAHFPTGLKWECASGCPSPEKIIICNADEGEPGTFKDKLIITNNPDNLIEGISIAAYAIGSKKAFIYLRAEYEYLKENLQKTINKYSSQIKKIDLDIEIVMGAGAYICGDETAIMNSIQELRGEPHAKPPYPVEVGLCNCPTAINNVETLTNVPLIMNTCWKDLRMFSLSGNLETPGIYELPLGITAKELMDKGKPKKPIKALFFGAAGGCVPYHEDLILDIDHIKEFGAMIGSCTVIAVDEDQSIPKICKNIAEFFVHESCGKCTPCREGNFRVLQILDRVIEGVATEEELTALEDLSNFINKTSLCGLGQASNTHIKTALKYFRHEFYRKD